MDQQQITDFLLDQVTGKFDFLDTYQKNNSAQMPEDGLMDLTDGMVILQSSNLEDLPTPPFPEAMAIIWSTPVTRAAPPICGVGCWPILSAGGTPADAGALVAGAVGPCAVKTSCTDCTPTAAVKSAVI